jgi:hypothetical protein
VLSTKPSRHLVTQVAGARPSLPRRSSQDLLKGCIAKITLWAALGGCDTSPGRRTHLDGGGCGMQGAELERPLCIDVEFAGGRLTRVWPVAVIQADGLRRMITG